MKAAEIEDVEMIETEDGIEQIDETPEQSDVETADAKTGEKPAAVVVDPKEFQRVQKELREARKQVREADEAARFWSERAQPKAAVAAEPEPDPEEIDVVTELTANGAKGLDKVLKHLGYAKKRDVDSTIATARAEITDQAKLIRDYPGLEDDTSPFFKATAAIYNSLKTDPHLAKSGRLIEIAARTAKAEMGTARRRAAVEPDVEDQDIEEFDEDPHTARVARQAGDRGRRDTRSAPEELTAMQKKMVRSFAAVGAPLTEESYAKRAGIGVRLAGRPQRRAA